MLVSFVFFSLCLIGSQILVDSEFEKIKTEHQLKRVRYVESLKNQVDSELNAITFLTSGISSYFSVYHKELNDHKVRAILADLHQNAKHTRNFGLAVGYRIKYIYPASSNEEAINLDYRLLPKQWPYVQKAIETKKGILEGPVNLAQGGSGLIYSYPIFIDDRYWGMVSTVINTASFFKSAFDGTPQDEFSFSVQLRSLDNQTLVYGSDAVFSHENVWVTTSDVPNGKLEWAVVNVTNNAPANITILNTMSWAMSIFLAGMLFLLLKDRRTLVAEAGSDSLTGIANRRSINKKIQQSLKYANNHESLIAIMFIDLDYFKKVNDAFGHDFGDEVLKVVSETLSHIIRAGDTLSRVGGDEFVILLNAIEKVDDGAIIANKVIEAFQYPVIVNGRVFKINLTIGVATSSLAYDEEMKSLMKKADIALYEAKASGRNKYMIYKEGAG